MSFFFLPQRTVAFKPLILLGLFPKVDGYFRAGTAAGSSARRPENQPAVGRTNMWASPRQQANSASWTGWMNPKAPASTTN